MRLCRDVIEKNSTGIQSQNCVLIIPYQLRVLYFNTTKKIITEKFLPKIQLMYYLDSFGNIYSMIVG